MVVPTFDTVQFGSFDSQFGFDTKALSLQKVKETMKRSRLMKLCPQRVLYYIIHFIYKPCRTCMYLLGKPWFYKEILQLIDWNKETTENRN